MADDWENQQLKDDEEERRRIREALQGPNPAPTSSTQTAPSYTPGQAGDPAYDANPRDYMINRDRASWEAQLRQAGGNLYDPSDTEGVVRQASYAQNAGRDPADFIREQIKIYEQRRTNTPGGAQPQQSRAPMPPVAGGGGGGGAAGFAAPAGFPDMSAYFQQQQQLQQQAQQQLQQLIAAQQQRAAEDAARRQQYENAVREQIMGILGQKPQTADQIAQSPESRSYQRLQQRAQELYRAQQAERAGVRGTGGVQGQRELGGELGASVQGGSRDLAERTFALQSQLMARELEGRRQQLMQALQIGAGLMSSEQQNQIRTELSQIDAALRQQGIGQQGALGGGQLSLGLLNAMLGNEQFYSGLGADIGYKNALLNQAPFQYLF